MNVGINDEIRIYNSIKLLPGQAPSGTRTIREDFQRSFISEHTPQTVSIAMDSELIHFTLFHCCFDLVLCVDHEVARSLLVGRLDLPYAGLGCN